MGRDVWVVPLEGAREPRPLLKSSAQEADATFSPDDHWLAYTSNESGRAGMSQCAVAKSSETRFPTLHPI
jgi:Tol biopolymer transport system component